MRYDALVFDNDGVLTTPTELTVLERAMATAFERVGVAEPPAAHVETLIGPTVDGLQSVARTHQVDPHDLWAAREEAAIDAQLEAIRAGEKRLYDDVSTITDLSVPRAIVSNNQHETIGNIVEHFELDGFDPWIGREPTLEGIRRKKPRPYYIEQAVEALDASNPLYVGDSHKDITAAHAAGIDAAFVRRPHREGYQLETDPTHELSSLDRLASLVSSE
ncbi:haloacid dehalogenase superfamily enzyme, subfamily IA [Halovivax ruber XH-70]|uniref:Haloacid dehalogenase superfamily enzyme, subfamily IA n=1 Tax=Halovivax ruber (strain DSM 18193 / JCM 13892 / XH-70) TaxID=797302 RepID=L0IE69_HALRX|nr:HAD-IA family hydrolase [Halovivax ruber]AGB16521.1 haloacid dehalogenase superfamily enzyme, subfamily IA [Halovivax ruber XH-70]